MKKRVTISIDEELNEKWNEISKKHGISKSGMVEDFIIQILPVLEVEAPIKMISNAMKKLAEGIDETASLFDDIDNNKIGK